MNESVAVAKEVDKKKDLSPTKSDDSVHCVQGEPERQLGYMRNLIATIRHDGGTPSIDSIATQLSSMHTTKRAPALLALQQTHGNRYVQRVVTGIQAKLVVGQPGDIYEQEADRVADEVMRMPEPGVQRQPEEEEEEELIQSIPLAKQITPLVQRQIEEEEEELLQTKKVSGKTSEVVPDLESRINSLRGGGRPLSKSERTYFEQRFGYDVSQVRVHTDAQAAESARGVNAKVYTQGQDVVFGAGQYTANTEDRKRLLAHELTHVVQKQGASQLSGESQKRNEITMSSSSKSTKPIKNASRNREIVLAMTKTLGQTDTIVRETVSVSGRTGYGIVQLSLDELNEKRERMRIRGRIEPLPATIEAMRDGAMYYDSSNDSLEAMCERKVLAERYLIGNSFFIIGYRAYKIIFRFGEEANRATDQDFLAMYRHERIHQTQYQALRRIDIDIARRNREQSEEIGRFTSTERMNEILGAMVPMDPSTREHDQSARASAVQQATGTDLTNRANREVIAHSTAFAQCIGSIDAAMNQLRQLVPYIPQIGSTPAWSYDGADQAMKNRTIEIVLSAVLRLRNGVQIFNTRILRDLELSTRRHSPSTRFMDDLRASCLQDPQNPGWLVPDPELLMTTPS